jgi:hypothetical protein
MKLIQMLLATIFVCVLAGNAMAQADCKNRGELDPMYCDENKDLVADHAEGSEEVEEPGHDRVHLHAGRGSRGLRVDLQAVHRPTCRNA